MSSPIPGSAKCKEILEKFGLIFPEFKNRVIYYQPFDRVSLRLTIGKAYYIFSYIDDKNWGFQTEKNYIDCQKGIKR